MLCSHNYNKDPCCLLRVAVVFIVLLLTFVHIPTTTTAYSIALPICKITKAATIRSIRSKQQQHQQRNLVVSLQQRITPLFGSHHDHHESMNAVNSDHCPDTIRNNLHQTYEHDEAEQESNIINTDVGSGNTNRRSMVQRFVTMMVLGTSTALSGTSLISGGEGGGGGVGVALAAATSTESSSSASAPVKANADFVLQQYEDFIVSPAGFSYRDVKKSSSTSTTSTDDEVTTTTSTSRSNKNGGRGSGAQIGDRVVFDWSGYTIGYFGRPFQAKGGPQGGAFDKELDYSRTVLGSNTMIKGLELGMIGMNPNDIRQILVPYDSNNDKDTTNFLSYPPTDLAHDIVGPKPMTFSGQRALNFVLENPRLDRTLLFNVKIIRIDKLDGKGKYQRGDL